MKGTILSIIELDSGAITPESVDTLHFAMQLGAAEDSPVTGLVLCAPEQTPDMEPLQQLGVDIVLLRNPLLDRYTAEGYTGTLLHYIGGIGTSYICIPHSATGTDFAPALGVKLGGPCITAVHSIQGTEHPPRFTRSVAGGKLEEDILPLSFPAVLTVTSGSPAPLPVPSGEQHHVTVMEADITLNNTLEVARTTAAAVSSSLLSAEVIIAAGKGVGSIEHMALLNDMASLFPRASIAGSRGACDMGLVDYGLQVGMTGKSVSPKLYIACGISGAIQHLAGMSSSKYIVAINKDPDAPIFQKADYGI
nr:electron transfer flavoprotein subunit alpha/FixB family protein [Spirochaetota bacterium]